MVWASQLISEMLPYQFICRDEEHLKEVVLILLETGTSFAREGGSFNLFVSSNSIRHLNERFERI